MYMKRIVSIAALSLAPLPVAAARPQAPAAAAPATGYSDVADLVLAAPVVIDATIRSATRITGAEAANVAPGSQRHYVEVDVGALIRGAGALPARVGYLVDVPLDFRGRAPRQKRMRVIAIARPVPGRPAQLQLVDLNAQREWSPALDQRVRGVVREVLATGAPPAITGIGDAVHVPGTLPGEGETQIFLQTETGAPVSLLILRRPGEQRRWSLSLGDIVDESAGNPPRDTLAWYRLACGLPRTLPQTSVATQEPAAAAIAAEDYGFVLEQLGACRG